MSIGTFSVFSSIFGFAVAAISLFAFLINICRSHLPSNRIKALESLMDETETLFQKAVEDGLLIEPEFVRQTERHLTMLRMLTYRLQSRAYNATTLRQDYIELFKGTSQSIGTTCQSLKELRAQVITCSEKGRCRLMEIDSVTHSAPSPVLPLISDPECHPSPLLSSQIYRPRSCPPVLSGWRLDDARHGFAQGNPFRNPAQSDSDVRTADTQTYVSTIHTSVTAESGDLEFECKITSANGDHPAT